MRPNLLALLFLLLLAPLFAENIVVNGKHQALHFTLKPGDRLEVPDNHNAIDVDGSGALASLGGNHNNLVLRGALERCDVVGNHNMLVVDGEVGEIRIQGDHNAYRLVAKAGRRAPKVLDEGRYNVLLGDR